MSSLTTWSPAVQSNMSISFNIFLCSNNDFMQSYHSFCTHTTFVTVKSTNRIIRIRRYLAITVKYTVQQLLTITVIRISSSSSYHHRLLGRSLSSGQDCKTRNPQNFMMSSAHFLITMNCYCPYYFVSQYIQEIQQNYVQGVFHILTFFNTERFANMKNDEVT